MDLRRCLVRGCPETTDTSVLFGMGRLEFVNLANCPRIPTEQIDALKNMLPECVIIHETHGTE